MKNIIKNINNDNDKNCYAIKWVGVPDPLASLFVRPEKTTISKLLTVSTKSTSQVYERSCGWSC